MRNRLTVISASEFKARCLQILDELEPRGIVVTKRGRPVAKLTPLRPAKFASFYGRLKGKIEIRGDIFSTGAKWNAQS